MRKVILLSLLLVVILAVTLSGCSDSGTPTGQVVNDNSFAPQNVNEPAGSGAMPSMGTADHSQTCN